MLHPQHRAILLGVTKGWRGHNENVLIFICSLGIICSVLFWVMLDAKERKEMPLEKEITKKIMLDLSDRPKHWFYKNYSGMGMGKAGVPDVIGHIKGIFVAIEVKRPKNEGGKLSKLQAYEIRQIQAKGGIAIVVYSYQDYLEQIIVIRQLVDNICLEQKHNTIRR